jgi:hypothetical protein
VFQLRQDLPLVPKLTDGKVRIRTTLYELEGHLHAELVLPKRAVYGAHSTAADQLENAIGPDYVASHFFVRRHGAGLRHVYRYLGYRGLDEPIIACIRRKE